MMSKALQNELTKFYAKFIAEFKMSLHNDNSFMDNNRNVYPIILERVQDLLDFDEIDKLADEMFDKLLQKNKKPEMIADSTIKTIKKQLLKFNYKCNYSNRGGKQYLKIAAINGNEFDRKFIMDYIKSFLPHASVTSGGFTEFTYRINQDYNK